MNRFLYILSQLFDMLFLLLFTWTIQTTAGMDLIKIQNHNIKYTNNINTLLFILFVISYFIVYPLLNNKMSMFQNILSLKIVNNKVKFIKILLTNMVFWLSLCILILKIVDVPSIDFHSNYIIIFGAIIYLIFLLLEIDLISTFGSNIKFKREE